MSTMETKEFLGSPKLTCQGQPQKIYSDKGCTFVGGTRFMRTVMEDESLQDFLASNRIRWQLNVSHALWWGSQFEQIVALLKSSFSTWRQPYIEDDVQLPILMPNFLMFTLPNALPELAAHHIKDGDLRKQAKFLKRCKDALWKRWMREYLRGL